MDTALSTYFISNSFKQMMMPSSEYTTFIKEESNFVLMVFSCDLRVNPFITPGEFSDMRTRCIWRLKDQGINEVHAVSIVVSEDMTKALALGEGDSFFWIYDPLLKDMIVPEGKAEDFYGLRSELSVWVKEDHSDQKTGAGVRYTASGRSIRSLKAQPLVNHSVFALNILLFTFCTFTGRLVYNMGELSLSEVMNGQWYRVITAMFLHADMSHLAGNMIMLFYIGNLTESALGHLKYFILYFVSGICGSVASLLMQYMHMMSGGDPAASIGASGAIFGVMGAFLWVLIKNKGGKGSFSFPRVLFLICYALYGGLTSTGVDNAAHIGGVISGFILGVFLYRKRTERRLT